MEQYIIWLIVNLLLYSVSMFFLDSNIEKHATISSGFILYPSLCIFVPVLGTLTLAVFLWYTISDVGKKDGII